MSNTLLLIQSESANGSTTFSDSSSHNYGLTSYGATHSTTVAKFGNSSININDGQSLRFNNILPASFNFGLNDFTIDFWVWKSSTGILDYAFELMGDGSNELSLRFRPTIIEISIFGVINLTFNQVALPTSTWHHHAIIRQSGIYKYYIDGDLKDTNSNYTAFQQDFTGGELYIGNTIVDDIYGLNGYIEEFRIVSNEAVWTANFTPPTSSYPNENATNGYVPPSGDNIQFVFSEIYTPLSGDNIIFNFATSSNVPSNDFNFIDNTYTPPTLNNIVFWFLQPYEILFPNNVITTSSSIDIFTGYSLQSVVNTVSSVTPYYDKAIVFDNNTVNTISSISFSSNAITQINIPISIVQTTSSITYNNDVVIVIPIGIVNTSSQLQFRKDINISLANSVVNLISSFNFIISANIQAVSTTISSISYNRLTTSEHTYLINLGQITSNHQYINTLQESFNNDFDYINGLDIASEYEYKIGIELISDNVVTYDLFKTSRRTFEYNNTLLDVVNSDNQYSISMYIISDNQIINNIRQNVLNTCLYSNQLSLFGDKPLLISENIYNNDLTQNIINNISYINFLSNALVSNNEYKNTYYLNNTNQYINNLNQIVVADNIYKNLLSNILQSNIQYKNGINIDNSFAYNNAIGLDVISDNTYNNNLTAYITSGLTISNDLLESNIIYSNNKIAYYLGSNSSIYTENSIQAYINNQLIDIINCNIDIDEDSFSYNFSAEVSTLKDWFLCVPNQEIIIYLNANEYRFIIDSRSRTREFNSDKYTFEARSKTAILDKNVVTKTYESVFVSDVIQELCNNNLINYNYNMIDWNLPSGLLTADKESPISIMQRLAGTCGGIIICDNLGNLKFNSKYPISPLLYNSSVDSFNDYDNIFNVSESTEINDKWNAVIVSNISESQDYSYSISEINDLEDDIYTKHLRVKVYPYLQEIDLLTSFISSGIVIRDYNNPITETISDEIIEIVEGKGNTSESIKQIINYSYLNTNLGTLQFNNNEITTQIYGQSLIKITYKTEYHDFILHNGIKTSDIQVYTTDENEVI